MILYIKSFWGHVSVLEYAQQVYAVTQFNHTFVITSVAVMVVKFEYISSFVRILHNLVVMVTTDCGSTPINHVRETAGGPRMRLVRIIQSMVVRITRRMMARTILSMNPPSGVRHHIGCSIDITHYTCIEWYVPLASDRIPTTVHGT